MSCQDQLHDAIFASQPYATVCPAMVVGQRDGIGAFLRSFTRLLPEGLHALAGRIEAAGGQAFLVGGPNRDLYRAYLSGKTPEQVNISDLDVEVFGLEIDRLLPLVQELAGQAGGGVTSIDRRFQVTQLHLPGVQDHIDIAIARRERTTAIMRCEVCGASLPYPQVSEWDREHRHCPECDTTGSLGIDGTHQAFDASFPSDITIPEAAERRDLTVNAMYLNLAHSHLVDPYNGIQDMHRGVVRMVNPKTFVEDPVRFIRAARFSGVLRFAIDPELRRLAGPYAYTLRNLTHNLVRTEYEKLLGKGGKFAEPLEYLAASGWLPGVSDRERLLANARQLDAWLAKRQAGSVVEAFPLENCPPEKRLTRRAALVAAILLHGQPESDVPVPADGPKIKVSHPSADIFRTFTKCRDKDMVEDVARLGRALAEPTVRGDNLLLLGEGLRDTFTLSEYLEARAVIGLPQVESAVDMLRRHAGRIPRPLINGDEAMQLIHRERGLAVGNSRGNGFISPKEFGEFIKTVRYRQLTGELQTREDAERLMLALLDGRPEGAAPPDSAHH